MTYMYDSDNHSMDLSGLGAPRKKRSVMTNAPSHQLTEEQQQRRRHQLRLSQRHKTAGLKNYDEDNSMLGFLEDLGLTAEQKAAKAAAKVAKKAAKAEKKAAVAAKKEERQEHKVERQTAQKLKKEARQEAQVAKKEARVEKKEERKAVAAAKKAARIAGKNVNITAKNPKDQPKADALAAKIDAQASNMKAQLPQLQAKLAAKKKQRDDLKAKLPAKKAGKGIPKTPPSGGLPPIHGAPGGGIPADQYTAGGLTVRPTTSPRKPVVLPRRPITKLKGIGFLGMSWLGEGDYETQMGYFGLNPLSLTQPATGTPVGAAPIMPQGYMNRKNKGKPNVKDQLYELTLYTQQTVGPLADEMATLESMFTDLVNQTNDVDAQIQDLLAQIAAEPAPTATDGGLVDTGVDQGLTEGGMDVGYGDITQVPDDTGGGLEVSQAEGGETAAIQTDQGDIYGGEEGADLSTGPMLPPATITPTAAEVSQSEYQTEDIAPVDMTSDVAEGSGMEYEGDPIPNGNDGPADAANADNQETFGSPYPGPNR